MDIKGQVNDNMDDYPCIHHIEIGVTNGLEAVAILQQQYRLKLLAKRTTDLADQWALLKNDTHFLVTCLKNTQQDLIQNDEYIIDWMNAVGGDGIPRKDSVFNVCLQVCNLDAWVERLEKEGVILFKRLQVISDRFGSVKVCTIKSCVGDMYHTLVEKKNYYGEFLPGFEQIQSSDSAMISNCLSKTNSKTHDIAQQSNSFCNRHELHNPIMEDRNPNSTHKIGSEVLMSKNSDAITLDQQNFNLSDSDWTTFDHVLLAVAKGTTNGIIKWYEQLFGMKRFLINSDDNPEDGLVLSSKTVGLRLRAMEYWKCAEVGLKMPGDREGGKSKLFFVIGEGLPPVPGVKEENQIELWMKQHRGPGIQHIAFNTPNIKATVEHLKSHGVSFANPPPPSYYTKVGRLQDITDAGENVDLLRKHGILIDTEADGMYEEEHLNETQSHSNGKNIRDKYLLQIFTQPVFKSDPFFMEIIQREGATGFGSGNVAALYRSVQAYIEAKDREMCGKSSISPSSL